MITATQLIDYTEVEALRGLIPEDIYEGFTPNSGRMAFCAATKKAVCGILVFDAKKSAVIQSLYVMPKYRKKYIGTELLETAISICKDLGCDGITASLYDADDVVIAGRMLTKEGFEQVSFQTVYRFDLKRLASNRVFAKVSPCDNVIALSEADEKAKKVFSNDLIRTNQYDHFLDPGFDQDVSAVFVKDKRILGCVLVSRDEEDGSISIDYANTNNCGNKMALMFLLKHAFDVYSSTLVEDEDTYFPDDGYILATNESVGTLVKKILPDAEVVDQINTYALAL